MKKSISESTKSEPEKQSPNLGGGKRIAHSTHISDSRDRRAGAIQPLEICSEPSAESSSRL